LNRNKFVTDRQIIETADGSHSISIPEMNVTYHSRHGAIQESMHVFVEAGFRYISNQLMNQQINIFEMGLGTEEVLRLNYSESLKHKEWFMALHECKWDEDIAINEYFTFRKEQVDIINYSTNQPFNIVYYDAFAPTAQPELWTTEIFNKLNSLLFPEGILVTYCSKGDVRRAMQKAGLIVEKIPGPPGKREMVRAFKI
jgi:tRNA U34 5-methylaminomethyl-2-thiouridine-forming methyltransferase MnmC